MTLRIIAGTFKGRLLKAPKAVSTRPTQGMLREAVFNILQNQIGEARFLDLFAGSGAMGFEALSRGAAFAAFVEQNRQASACIKENAHSLQVENQMELFPMPAERALALLNKQNARFDLVYIDPPYDTPISYLQTLLTHLESLLLPNALVFIEERHSPKAPPFSFESPNWMLKNSRRFGIALLHQFSFSGMRGA